jgi:hypothetical protein
MKLTILLHLMPRLRISGDIPLLPSVCLHGVDREDFTFSYLQAYARTVPQIRPYLLPSTSFPIHYSIIILTFGAVYSAIPAALLSKPYV